MIAPADFNTPDKAELRGIEAQFARLSAPSDRTAFLSRDFTPERTDNKLPDGPPASHRISGVDFSSASEATCAILFEKYISGFMIEPGKNYQIQIGISLRGNPLYADFEIAGAIVEFHPPRLWRPGRPYGDFKSRKEHREYRRQMRQADPVDRKSIKERTVKKLGDQYSQTRRRILDETPELKAKALIVAFNEGDLYDKVIARYGFDIPAKKDFLKEFARVRKDIHKNHSLQHNTDEEGGNRKVA